MKRLVAATLTYFFLASPVWASQANYSDGFAGTEPPDNYTKSNSQGNCTFTCVSGQGRLYASGSPTGYADWYYSADVSWESNYLFQFTHVSTTVPTSGELRWWICCGSTTNKIEIYLLYNGGSGHWDLYSPSLGTIKNSADLPANGALVKTYVHNYGSKIYVDVYYDTVKQGSVNIAESSSNTSGSVGFGFKGNAGTAYQWLIDDVSVQYDAPPTTPTSTLTSTSTSTVTATVTATVVPTATPAPTSAVKKYPRSYPTSYQYTWWDKVKDYLRSM